MEIKPATVVMLIGIPALLAGAVTAWDIVGWTTPATHQTDLQSMGKAYAEQSVAVLDQLKQNRDEWWCDEESEYLDELLRLQDAGNNSAAIQQEVKEQRDKMGEVKCFRFDKD
jgi:hypothetical protein